MAVVLAPIEYNKLVPEIITMPNIEYRGHVTLPVEPHNRSKSGFKVMKTCLACINDALVDAEVGDTLSIEIIAMFHDEATGECFNHEND